MVSEYLEHVPAECEDTPKEQMGMVTRLRLHETSHDAERHEELVSLRDHPRDDCVIRPFAAFDVIRMTLSQREPGSTVLQRETATLGDRASSETFVQRSESVYPSSEIWTDSPA